MHDKKLGLVVTWNCLKNMPEVILYKIIITSAITTKTSSFMYRFVNNMEDLHRSISLYSTSMVKCWLKIVFIEQCTHMYTIDFIASYVQKLFLPLLMYMYGTFIQWTIYIQNNLTCSGSYIHTCIYEVNTFRKKIITSILCSVIVERDT